MNYPTGVRIARRLAMMTLGDVLFRSDAPQKTIELKIIKSSCLIGMPADYFADGGLRHPRSIEHLNAPVRDKDHWRHQTFFRGVVFAAGFETGTMPLPA